MDVKGQEEFKGWCKVVFVGDTVRSINIDHVITDTKGHTLFLVGADKTYYNFGTVISIKRGTY